MEERIKTRKCLVNVALNIKKGYSKHNPSKETGLNRKTFYFKNCSRMILNTNNDKDLIKKVYGATPFSENDLQLICQAQT